MKKLLLLPLILIVLFISTPAQKIAVSLVIQTEDDKFLHDKIESYITRELRSLGDVTIVDKDPFYTLNVIMISASQDGTTIGYFVTSATIVHLPCTMFGREKVCDIYRGSLVQSVGIDGLKEMCNAAVVSFDKNELKTLRTTSAPSKSIPSKPVAKGVKI